MLETSSPVGRIPRPEQWNSLIPISRPSITDLEIGFVTDAVKSTWVSSLGEYLEKFEKEFAGFCEAKHAVSVFNGTVALHLALVAQDIGPGDEVIVPNLSFIATVNAILYTGATPVFVDIDPFNLGIDPDDVKRHITKKTKAILPVHLYGHPADMQALTAICEEHGLIMIEDAAEAHGALAYGKKVGSWGNCAAFSFYGNKIMTTGEGGMITTNDDTLNLRLRHLRDHAMSKTTRYWHDSMGFNYRMTNLQAALGYAQLLRIDDLLSRRKQIFEHYQRRLGHVDHISLNRSHAWANPTYWLVCLEFMDELTARRESLMNELKMMNVDTRPYFFPMSQMPYIRSTQEIHTPISERKSKEGINLPTYFDLTTQEMDYICDCILSLL